MASARDRQLVDALQADLHHLCTEAKKKCPALKLTAERALLRLRGVTSSNESFTEGIARADDIIHVFLVGCDETKHPRVIQLCVTCILRLIDNAAVSPIQIEGVLNAMWKLMEAGQEELKILQCVLGLITRCSLRGEALSKGIVLCFRLHFTKGSTTTAIAAATLRQIVTVVFERVTQEDADHESGERPQSPERRHPNAPVNLGAAAADAFLLFQDLCLLTNGEQPHWLSGMVEMTRTFGLELLEAALTASPELVLRHPEFSLLLKEKVCALVIKLFSPNVKHGGKASTHLLFPVTIRLLRVMSVLIKHFFSLLTTESEIFLSMLVRFLDADKPTWQRASALEVLHSLCTQPALLRSFCHFYDMQTDSTRIFQDLINAVGAAVQGCFQAQSEGLQTPAAANKPTFIEMMDKNEPPTIPESYFLSVAFGTLIDTVKSISSLVAAPTPMSSLDQPMPAGKEEDIDVMRTIVESSWGGLLAALTLLLRQSTGAGTTESILRAYASFTRVCGVLRMNGPRDAFLTSLCNSCLPLHFSLTSDPPPRGWTVDDKNLRCVHTLLNTSLCLGGMMDSAWFMILSTAQKLSAILQLSLGATTVPTSLKGSSRVTAHRRTNSGTKDITISASNASELPALSAMLSQLFEASKHLDDTSLQHIVQALCQLSEETMLQVDAAQSVLSGIFRNDAHLFPTAKLLDVSMVNLDRLMLFWPAVTAHLIEVSSHGNESLRAWGMEALTLLVRAALAHPRDPPIQDSPGLQQAILSPLRNLASNEYPDARERQLECVRQVLDSCGQSLAYAWPVVLGIIHDALVSLSTPDSPALRIAFESMEMIVADFLLTVPIPCYITLLETLGRFGQISKQVNISLTAVGLIWNISDHLTKNHDQIASDLAERAKADGPVDAYGFSTQVSVNSVWLSLFEQLAKICLDERPEVRKSANQTLFSTVSTHGTQFPQSIWNSFLWQVLFPLVENVKAASTKAAESKESNVPEGMMVHYSRNTAEKQWDETRVITLTGVARVFTSYEVPLLLEPDFLRAWALVLQHVQASAKESSNEVSLAATQALQELFRLSPESDASSYGKEIWDNAWQTWIDVADYASTCSPVPKSAYLRSLLECFSLLYKHLQPSFSAADARRTLAVVTKLTALPHNDALIVTSLTDVQSVALSIVKQLCAGPNSVEIVPRALETLSIFVLYGCQPPDTRVDVMLSPSRQHAPSKICASFVNLSLACLDEIVRLLSQHCDSSDVIFQEISKEIVKTLREPMILRYSCTSLDLWRKSVYTFVTVVEATARGMGSYRQANAASGGPTQTTAEGNSFDHVCQSFWLEVLRSAELSLFSLSEVPLSTSPEQRKEDEALDVEVIRLLRDAMLAGQSAASDRDPASSVLPLAASSSAPVERIPTAMHASVFEMFKRGSVNSVSALGGDAQSQESVMREQFARACFEALLDTASVSQGGQNFGVELMLDGCREVIDRFLKEDTGATEMSNLRKSEMKFVLRAVGALISTETRDVAGQIYPSLVRCTLCNSTEIRQSLHDTLMRFNDLLRSSSTA